MVGKKHGDLFVSYMYEQSFNLLKSTWQKVQILTRMLIKEWSDLGLHSLLRSLKGRFCKIVFFCDIEKLNKEATGSVV